MGGFGLFLYHQLSKMGLYDNKRKKYKEFYVEFEPFKVFYRAEEYHQNYLIKHPDGYCHITNKEMEEVGKLN